MSAVDVASIKRFLRVDHSHDDTLLQELLDSAESQALAFLNADSLAFVANQFGVQFESSEASTSEPAIPPDILTAIKQLVRADYEGENAQEVASLRHLAESLLFPYRQELGA